MVRRDNLVEFLDGLLRPEKAVADSSNNGLQVEGGAQVRRAVFAVDASRQLFQAAAEAGADFVFVHHGISWKDSLKYLTGLNAGRAGLLFRNNLSLYASHLPLDMHPKVGHNACMAEHLGLADRQAFCVYGGAEIGWCGNLPEATELGDLAARVNAMLGAQSQLWDNAAGPIRRLGVVSGGAADAIYFCGDQKLDCLLTGEAGHQHFHDAKELGVSVIAAGHYLTETPGVKKVMQAVQAVFDVECSFVDLPTGY